jgi:hypothetical protein
VLGSRRIKTAALDEKQWRFAWKGLASLSATSGELGAAQVRAGDLLVAAEANAETIVVRCQRGKGCAVRRIGVGPANAHAEGHIAFLGVRR